MTYHSFPAAAQTAFQAAADIWAADVSSPVPVTVDVTWAAGTDGNNLAGTAPTLVHPAGGSVWYPQALADRIAGQAVDPGTPDIVIDVNSQPTGGWYLGTDGRPGAGLYDLTTVALHELAHGLGIFGLFSVDAQNVGSFGASPSLMNLPTVFDAEVQTLSGQKLVTAFANPSAALGTALTSGSLIDGGPQGKLGDGGVAARLFAPSAWQSGSSLYHTDFGMFPAGSANSLMDAGIPAGAAIHDPGPVVEGFLDDLGWASVPGRATDVKAQPGSGQASVSWAPPAFTGGSTISGYVITAVGPGGTVAAEQNAGGSPMTLAGLASGTTYAIAVQAVNSVGRGPASSPVNVAISAAGGPTTTSTTTISTTTTSTTAISTTTTSTTTPLTTTTVAAGSATSGSTTTSRPSGSTTTTTVAKCVTATGSAAAKPATSSTGGKLASTGATEPIPLSLAGLILIGIGSVLAVSARCRFVWLSWLVARYSPDPGG